MPTTKQDTKPKGNLLDALEESENIGGGGQGYIGKVIAETGWKIFVSGLSNAESFFPYDPFDKDTRDAAFAEAKQALPMGSTARPNTAFQLTMFKNSVLNKDTSAWKEDRVWVIPMWTESYKKVVKPAIAALIENGTPFDMGEEVWMRVSFKADPTGRTKKNYKWTEGSTEPEQVVELIAYPAEIYASKQAAEDASGDAPATSFSANGSQSDALEQMKNDPEFLDALRAAVKGKPKAKHADLVIPVIKEYLSEDTDYIATILPVVVALAMSPA